MRHNTNVFKIKIYYPYHPYYGQELDIVYKPNRKEGLVTVHAPHGNQQKIPEWMLAPQAAEYTILNSRFYVIDEYEDDPGETERIVGFDSFSSDWESFEPSMAGQTAFQFYP